VVDFVFVLVLLVPLVLGILQLGLVLHVRNTLASAAAEGARAGAVLDAPPGTATATTREQIVGAVDSRFAGDVRESRAVVDGADAVVVTISATIPTLGLGGPAVSFEVSGNAVVEQLPAGDGAAP
jgi:Flp pilus assembly protein TadG